MPTKIRPNLSEKNKYWIEKHRYYELKHLCFQYPIWVKAYTALDGLSKRPDDIVQIQRSNTTGDPTLKCVLAMEHYSERIKMIEETVLKTDKILAPYILKGVTQNCTYEYLQTKYNIPCGRSAYYELYRKFFWLLNKARD